MTLQQIKPTQLPNQSKLYSPSFLDESGLLSSENIFLFLMSKSSLPAFIKKKKKGEEEKNTMKRSEM